jgi:uncharacterized protein YegP (UPF0339 family)
MSAKYEIYKDKAGEHRFRLKASNGETILASEGYSSKSGCQNGIASVQKNSGSPRNFEARTSKSGKHYFVLKAANHQVIGTSEMYNSEAAMKNGIASVARNGKSTTIDE